MTPAPLPGHDPCMQVSFPFGIGDPKAELKRKRIEVGIVREKIILKGEGVSGSGWQWWEVTMKMKRRS